MRMEWTDDNLTTVTEAARRLLSRLGLAEYRFELAPRARACRVRVMYAGAGAWESTTLNVDPYALVSSQGDSELRSALLDQWRRVLARARYY
jgi:hypothetical protein